MRHVATFCNQFPDTAYIASILLHNPFATADVQKKLLATDRGILNDYRIIKSLTLQFYIRVFPWKFIFSSR